MNRKDCFTLDFCVFPCHYNHEEEMKMGEKGKFMDKAYTRRQFLKLSGKSLVGYCGIRYCFMEYSAERKRLIECR